MKTIKLPNNRTLKVLHESNPSSPREWDNITKMIFFGKYSHTGDKHDMDFSNCDGWDDNEAVIKKHYGRDLVHIQRVYGYSHSGLTISLSPFSCPWDSGILGLVIVTRKDVIKLMGNKYATKKIIAQAISQVKSEVNTLDQYIRGDVYGFQINDVDGNVEDSCWGFYGGDIHTNGIIDNLNEEDSDFIKKSE